MPGLCLIPTYTWASRLSPVRELPKLAAGETIDQLLAAHLRLTREDIQATLAYAAHTLRSDIVFSESA